MPVRVYDIAKKLGIDLRIVLAKAKELGIPAARVPSSSLDKITAEFLEGHCVPETETYLKTRIREIVFRGESVPQKYVKRFPGYVRECREERRQRKAVPPENS